jgi:stage V sporulation protein AE
MSFLIAFLVGGGICMVAQIILDKFKLLPLHLTIMFVIIGAFLESFGIYDNLLDKFQAGLFVQISSFGHAMTHGAVASAKDYGIIGLFKGMFTLSSTTLTFTIFISFVTALVFKPKG